MTDTSLRRAGLILIGTTAIAKFVGFLREAVIASTYGTTHTVDVYLAAMTLPAMAVTIVFHSVPNAFVPLFSEAGAKAQVRRQSSWLLGAMFLLTIGTWVLAGSLARLTNSGFLPEFQDETVIVLRITAVAMALATVEALTRSRLLAQRRFARAGLSLLWQSSVMIGAILIFPDGGARTLAWGFVAGGAAAALWNLLPAMGRQTGAASTTDRPDPEVVTASIGFWVPIVLLADSIPQLYAIIDRHLGSYLIEGSIAALQYSSLLATMPVSICGLTLGTAIFPFLSSAVQAGDSQRVSEILDKAMRWSLFVGVPVSVWLLYFSPEVTRLLFERGAFNEESRALTASTLRLYSLGVVPSILMAIFAKVYYSSRRSGPVLLAAILGLGAKVAFSFWWGPRFGTTGLAAASTVAAVAVLVTFIVALPRPNLAVYGVHWLRTSVSLATICLAGGLVASSSATLLAGLKPVVRDMIKLALGVTIGSGAAIVLGPVLRIQELITVRKWIWRR